MAEARSALGRVFASIISIAIFSDAARASSESDADRKADAARYLEEGNRYFARELYKEALSRYRQAFETYPSPRLFFSMARAYDVVGDLGSAAEHYERFLIEAGVAAESRLHARALARLSTLANELGRLHLVGSPPGAKAAVDDGNPAVTLPNRPLYLVPGRHRVRVELDGYAPFEARVLITKRLISEVKVDMPPLRVVAPVERSLPAPAYDANSLPIERTINLQPPPPVEESGGILSSWWFWAAIAGVAAVGTGAAIVFTRSRPGASPPELGTSLLPNWERR
jgi:PEGA domain-containing protein